MFARSLYGQLRAQQAQIQLTFPFRIDLMPGTVVELENTEAAPLSFIGDSLFGMVQSVTIACSTLEDNPSLLTTVQLVSVRNTQDNDDDNITFDGHPIYEGRWVGIDLDGILLKDEGESGNLTTNPTTTYNSVDGKKTGV